MLGAIAIGCGAVLLSFWLREPSASIVALLFIPAWLVALLGMVGHWRWAMKHGREGKVGWSED